MESPSCYMGVGFSLGISVGECVVPGMGRGMGMGVSVGVGLGLGVDIGVGVSVSKGSDVK